MQTVKLALIMPRVPFYSHVSVTVNWGMSPMVQSCEIGCHVLSLCFRSRQIESACFSGTAAFMEVRIQSVVVEFILNNTEALFSAKLNSIIRESTGRANQKQSDMWRLF